MNRVVAFFSPHTIFLFMKEKMDSMLFFNYYLLSLGLLLSINNIGTYS